MKAIRNIFLFVTSIFSVGSMATVLAPSPSNTMEGTWNNIWPGTFGQIGTVIGSAVALTVILWMAWVIQGLYVALIVKGQISAVEGMMLFLRLLVLVMAIFALLNS
ncbi:hypothetical protein [Vibrio mediterranei]|uniref:hypothetical protein n=1 Tax=Vibrio mediterranei TaxID=689 RepID=UPI00406771E2